MFHVCTLGRHVPRRLPRAQTSHTQHHVRRWYQQSSSSSTRKLCRPGAGILCGRLQSAWPLAILAENWHTGYSCRVQRSHQFWFVDLRLFVFELGARTGRTDGRTGKTHIAAYYDGCIINLYRPNTSPGEALIRGSVEVSIIEYY